MPNLCTGFINVRGYAPYVDEFIATLQADYSYMPDGSTIWCADPKNFTHIPHFFRIFDAYVMYDVYHTPIYKSACINIECAWSVWSCMFDGPHTYYNDFQKNHFGEHFGTNILKESKRLQLEIEIWSYETGMAFQEHYKICSGILVKNEVFNFNILWLEDYSNYNDFVKDCAYPPTINEQEFNDRINGYGSYYYEDGIHEEEVDFLPEDEPQYLCYLVMAKTRKG